MSKPYDKPDGWEFTKYDEENHRKKNKSKWEFEDITILPKPINLSTQRDDPHKIGLNDEQIIAMFNGLKDSFLYDYAYTEYFKEYHSDIYDSMYKYYEEYLLADDGKVPGSGIPTAHRSVLD